MHRRTTLISGAAALLCRSASAENSGVIANLEVDAGTLGSIPGDERAGLDVQRDNSALAHDLSARIPPGKAIPIIYIVIGILSIPTLWSTVREMLRRDYFGGVLIDLRGTQISIVSDPKVPANMVFVVQGDGSVKQFLSEDFSERTLSALIARKG
jgi:hypothetical protein